jgi:hypothetical protein
MYLIKFYAEIGYIPRFLDFKGVDVDEKLIVCTTISCRSMSKCPFFSSLPPEIRGLIYEHLISWQTKRVTSNNVPSTTVEVNCSIPTSFLLVSKAFSDELLVITMVLRDVRVDAGSVYDSLEDFVALWPHIVAYRTFRLSMHICNTLDVGYRMRWKRQYLHTPERFTFDKVIFLVNESLAGTLNVLNITMDLPELEPAQTMLQGIIDSVAEGKAEITSHRDRWNGYLCQSVEFARKRKQGQLLVKLSVRSRT